MVNWNTTKWTVALVDHSVDGQEHIDEITKYRGEYRA